MMVASTAKLAAKQFSIVLKNESRVESPHAALFLPNTKSCTDGHCVNTPAPRSQTHNKPQHLILYQLQNLMFSLGCKSDLTSFKKNRDVKKSTSQAAF